MLAETLMNFVDVTRLGALLGPLWFFIDLVVVDQWFAQVDDFFDIVFANWR